MANELKYKDLNGDTIVVEVDITEMVQLSVDSDTAESALKVVSPSYNTSTEFIGGRSKRG